MIDAPNFTEIDLTTKRLLDGVGWHAIRPCELRDPQRVCGPMLPWSTTVLPVDGGEWFGAFLVQRELYSGSVVNAVGPFPSAKDAEKWLIRRMQSSV